VSSSDEPSEQRAPGGALFGFGQLAELPDWLVVIVQPERVRSALAASIPEFVSGDYTLNECQISRLRMKKGRWGGLYHLSVTRSHDHQRMLVQTQGTLITPGQAEPDQNTNAGAFGADGWRWYVPELHLVLEAQPAEPDLPALPTLTDPEQSRALLEIAIREASPAYRELQLDSCLPRVVRNKPGSRCTILYNLAYPLGMNTDHHLPELVAVKTYKGSKGKNAYAGMRALWDSPFRSQSGVAMAEPLAYLPELSALVQGPIHEEQALKDLIRSALRVGTPAAFAELDEAMRKTAIGLAALHRSGAQSSTLSAWSDEFADLEETSEQLGAAIPRLAGVVAPLLTELAARGATQPADPSVASHGSFRPAQVLLYHDEISFIDFDSFCQAEPAMDLALFLSATKNVGLSEPHEEESNEDDIPLEPAARERLLDQLDIICGRFLDEYERHAPISRQRVGVWEGLNLLDLVLSCWTKIKPVRLANTLLMLERYLARGSVLNPSPQKGVA
jgi:hypothetical protein